MDKTSALYQFKRELDMDIARLSKHIDECDHGDTKIRLEVKKRAFQEVMSKLDKWINAKHANSVSIPVDSTYDFWLNEKDDIYDKNRPE